MSNKRLCIDVRMIGASGIGRYLANVVPAVIDALPDVDIALIGDRQKLSSFDWSNRQQVEIIHTTTPVYSVAEQLEIPRLIPRPCALYWSTHYNVPLIYNGRIITTIYDLAHLVLPEFRRSLLKRIYARCMFKALSHKSSLVMTISEFTKRELTTHTEFDPDKVHVLPLGIDRFWFEPTAEEGSMDSPYILFVGNVKPHKNLLSLIQAFDLVKDDIPHNLVVVGKKSGFITGDNEVLRYAGGSDDRVIFTGEVTDAELAKYYGNADLFVFPSAYEGFGLPPLEAMARGCPVIASRAASIPEVCGDGAQYFDHLRPGDIARKISTVLGSDEMQNEMRSKGLAQAKGYNWDKCRQGTVDLIKDQLSAVNA